MIVDSFNNLQESESAKVRITEKQKVFITFGLMILFVSVMLNWQLTLVCITTALTAHYLLDLLFNFYLVLRSSSSAAEIKISDEQVDLNKNREWPTYTIFCPLYKEWQILPQFVNAMANLDYPKDRLQVMLLLEEDDEKTIEKARKQKLPKNFEIVVVPDTMPKTKPKACNYGLQFATGEYSVIYDAEDVPDPLQLKKTVLAFEKLSSEVICVQAKLNYYNTKQNILTRLFTIEYMMWFGLILPGLQSLNTCIPLGGTSNHFKTSVLRKLQGWDAFNVTEDADLGVRLFKKGFKTAVLDVETLEEANSQFPNWIKQRSRWVKGYMQTYLVHTRGLKGFSRNKNFFHYFAFQSIIGGKVLALILNPFMWHLTIAYFVFRPYTKNFIESLYLTPVFYIGITTLLLGNIFYAYFYFMALKKKKAWHLAPYALLTPVYWAMMSVAAFHAVYELIVKPFYWNKTVHGLHLNEDEDFTENLILQSIEDNEPAFSDVEEISEVENFLEPVR